MNNRADMSVDGPGALRSRGGWGFTSGVLVGLGGAIAGLTLAVAAQRRARRQPMADGSAVSVDSSQGSGDRQAQENALDKELEQTFPASDPLPQSHRVD
ncbi:MAG TPA: hypothetical protein VN660_00740 [Steroidobacteraceae bacterium]|nr:hypothetical protein [Steroidobacteraceae bacterium]